MSSKIDRIKGFPQIQDYQHPWQFRRLDTEMRAGASAGTERQTAEIDFDRQLAAASSKFARSWKLFPVLKWGGIVVGILAVAALLMLVPAELKLLQISWVIGLFEKVSNLVTFKWVAFTVIGYLVGKYTLYVLDHRVARKIRKFLKLRSALSRIAVITGLAGVGFAAAGVHLYVFDRLFLYKGRRRQEAASLVQQPKTHDTQPTAEVGSD